MQDVIETSDSEFSQHWSTLYANDPVQNPLYMQRCETHARATAEQSFFTDRSFLIMTDDEPVFGCSLTMHIDDQGRNCMGYFGLQASAHVNRSAMLGASNNFMPEATRLLQQHVYKLIEETQPDSVKYLDPVSCGIMSPVTEVLLLKGGKPILQQAQLIDLTLSRRQLRRNVAGSYRREIEWGRASLEIEILSGQDFDEAKTDGVHTRKLDSRVGLAKLDLPGGLAYEKLIQQGNGFLVQGRYKNRLVCSSLFVHTDKTCHLVFADILPECPNRPVLPALIWEAMLHSKDLNCSRFDFGHYAIADSIQVADLKTNFVAENFGGESHTQLIVTLDR